MHWQNDWRRYIQEIQHFSVIAESTKYMYQIWEVFEGITWPDPLSLLLHIPTFTSEIFSDWETFWRVVPRILVSDTWMWTNGQKLFPRTSIKIWNKTKQNRICSKVSCLSLFLSLVEYLMSINYGRSINVMKISLQREF